MTMFARIACAWLGLMLTVPPALAADEEFDAKTAFARLKTLDGEWKVSDADKNTEVKRPDAKVIYKVTAAATTVMETQFPGTGHEMVTMYHLDGKQLVATHYCAAGNQPRLKLDLKASKPDRLLFVFDGGTNLDAGKDMHIHGILIKFLEGGKVESEWEGYMDGKKADTTVFPMTRP